jgi:hypothetical protein
MYELIWRNKFLTVDAKSLDDMAGMLEQAAGELRRMQAAGVSLSPDGRVEDDYAWLLTDDPAVAEEFGFDAVLGEEDEDEELQED